MIGEPKGAKEQIRLWVRRSLRSNSLNILKSLHVQYETIGVMPQLTLACLRLLRII